jgi:hypothetical protein
MTLGEIKAQVMFQTNNDAEDLPDFEPHLTDYINEGYDILVLNYAKEHVSTVSEKYPPLIATETEPEPVPNLPEYAHRALADYATYLVYRNGNAVKQNRGIPYYQAFNEVLVKLKYESGGGAQRFRNIYP